MDSRRRWAARGLVVVVVGVLFGTPAVAAQASSDLGLEASETVDGDRLAPDHVLQLDVADGETGAAAQFVLRQTNGTDSMAVRLRAVVGGKAISFAADGSAADQPVVVPEEGLVFVTASVDGVVDEVDARGELVAVADGRAQVLATVRLTKAAPAALVLSGAKDGVITGTATTDTFTQQLTVESTTTTETSAVIAVSTLRHDDAGSAAPTVAVGGEEYDQRTPIPIPAQGTARFTVTATLPRSGVWKGTISVVYGDTRQTTVLEITRRRLAPTITIDDITPVKGTLPFIERLPGDPPELQVRLRIHETEGQDLALELPSVLPLLLEEGENSFQIDDDDVRFVVDGEAAQDVTIPADGEVDLTVVFSGLDEPGKYTGRVKFASPGPTAIEEAFALFVRRSRWTAALFIGGAVALAALVRWFLVFRRGRLRALLRLSQLAKHVNDVCAATGQSPARYDLARHVRTRLDGLARRLSAGPVPDADIEREARRVELLARYLTVASRAEASANPSQHDAELDAVASVIREQDLTAEEHAAGDAKLAAIEHALSGADTVAGAVGALRNDIDAARQAGADAQLDRWIGLLDAATAKASTDPREAAKTYENVRRAWLDWLLNRLEERLAATAPPLGIEQADWDALKAQDSAVTQDLAAGKNATDPTTKFQSYEAAAGTLVQELASGLARRLGSKASAMANKDPELSGTLGDLADRAKAGGATAAAGQVAEAMTAYDAVVQEYRALEADLGRHGQQLGAANSNEELTDAPMDAGAAGTSVAGAAPEPPTPPQLTKAPPAWKATVELFAGELGVNLVLLGLAVIVGLVGLYEPSATWGDWEDIAVALLWGFGLHQLGNSAFGGISGLRTTLAAPPAN